MDYLLRENTVFFSLFNNNYISTNNGWVKTNTFNWSKTKKKIVEQPRAHYLELELGKYVPLLSEIRFAYIQLNE